MMRKLQGTDIDAATAQRVLDDSTSLATRAQQADAEAARRQDAQKDAYMTGGADQSGLKEEVCCVTPNMPAPAGSSNESPCR
jgi:hypothetical protein